MARYVPVQDMLHELRDGGMAVDVWTLVDDAQAQWDKLPPARRTAMLTRAGAPEWDPSLVKARVVRRRGRARTITNMFLELHVENGRLDPRSFVAYAAVAPAERPEADVVAETALKTAGWTRGRGRMIDVMDRVWGNGRYDVITDGHLVNFQAPEGHQEVERYWVDEPLSLVVIARAPDGALVYHAEEPRLTELERILVATINDRIRDTLVHDTDSEYRADDLVQEVFTLLRMYRPNVERRSAYKIAYFFLRNYLAMGPLEPILRDPHVEDVSCNGPRLPAYVAHARLSSVRTNLVFDELELNSYTIKLAQRGGKLLSVAQPLVDATLPDGSRLQAALGREVTSRGSAFTIRKFREDPLTAVDLIQQKTHSLDTMAFLWLAVEMRRSMLVMGATASGKTTTLNCLSQFIPPASKIVSIEDTRELTLQHENWLAAVTRDGLGSGADNIGMYDLLRAALRQRPEYLLVGEIRGEEGLTLFQAMSTGHTCFSTMHAGSVENAVYRLENPPIGVPRVMLTSLDFLILQGQVDVAGRGARRMLSLTELNGMDPQTRNLRTNEVFRWDPVRGEQSPGSASYVFEQSRAKLGWTRARLDEELAARRTVLERLVTRNERHYTDVAKAVRAFYAEREAAHLPPRRIEVVTADAPAKRTVPVKK